MIPAIGAFERAWRVYRGAGDQFTNQVGDSFLLGIVLTLVTAAFLFNLGWKYFGPALIILAGLGILMDCKEIRNASLPVAEAITQEQSHGTYPYQAHRLWANR